MTRLVNWHVLNWPSSPQNKYMLLNLSNVNLVFSLFSKNNLVLDTKQEYIRKRKQYFSWESSSQNLDEDCYKFVVKTLIIPTKIIYIFLIVFLWFLWELVLVFLKYVYVEGIGFKVLRLPLIIASTSLSGTSLVFMICLNRFSDIFPVFSVSKFLEWCVWH